MMSSPVLLGALLTAFSVLARAAPENKPEGGEITIVPYPVMTTMPQFVGPPSYQSNPQVLPVGVAVGKELGSCGETIVLEPSCPHGIPCDLPLKRRPLVNEPAVHNADLGPHSLSPGLQGWTYDTGYSSDNLNGVAYPHERFAGVSTYDPYQGNYPLAPFGKDHGLLGATTGSMVSDLESVGPSEKIAEDAADAGAREGVLDLNGRIVPSAGRWLQRVPEDLISSNVALFDGADYRGFPFLGSPLYYEASLHKAASSKSDVEDSVRYGTIVNRLPCEKPCDKPCGCEKPKPCGKPCCNGGYPPFWGPYVDVDTEVLTTTPGGRVIDVDTNVLTGRGGTILSNDIDIGREKHLLPPYYWHQGQFPRNVPLVRGELESKLPPVACVLKGDVVVCSRDAVLDDSDDSLVTFSESTIGAAAPSYLRPHNSRTTA